MSTKIPQVYVRRLFARSKPSGLPSNARDCSPPLTKPCLIWSGATDQKGYGVIRLRALDSSQRGTMGVPSGLVRVHRLAYWIANGAFPITCEIDHKCRRKNCVEAEHLQLQGPTEHARLSNLDRWLDHAEKVRVLPPAPDSDEVL